MSDNKMDELFNKRRSSTGSRPNLEDLMGIEHSKLGFFQEVQSKIIQLRASNRQLDLQRKEIEAILDGVTDIMVVLTPDMEILSVNHVFHSLFEEKSPEGKSCRQVFRGKEGVCPDCPAKKAFEKNDTCKSSVIYPVMGRNRHFEIIATPLRDPAGEPERVLLFKRDVTTEKEFQANFYLAEKMATIGVLAAGVAHEVNNPLTAICGFAEGLQRRLPKLEESLDDELYEDFKEYTETIISECNRCREIVRSLLTFSRPIASAFSPLDLNAVINDTVLILRHRLKYFSASKLKLELEQGMPSIYGDESQLKQVVLNLLTNAMDAVQNGGSIAVTTRMKGEFAVLEVSDNGCGIPYDNMDKLFEPFFTTKPVGKGIGIGLSTCYNIVQHHNGEIKAESREGEGTTFRITLPKQPSHEE